MQSKNPGSINVVAAATTSSSHSTSVAPANANSTCPCPACKSNGKNCSPATLGGKNIPPISVLKPPPQTRLFGKRWVILVVFGALSLSNAFQWIEYSIIGNVIVKYYGVSFLAVDWTSMIYMLAYIPLVFPATWLLDKYGLRICALLGSFGNCFGAWIKCASVGQNLFIVTFVGQAIVGTSQIFILGIPPRLAAVWFGPKEVSKACAFGVFGNQIGIALGFLLPPLLVHDGSPEQIASGLQKLFFSIAAMTSVIFLLVLFVFSDSPALPPSLAQLAAIQASVERHFLGSLRQLLTNGNYIILLVTYGINVGAFYAVSTLLNQVVLSYHKGEEENVGIMGLLIVVAGMGGSLICGIWLDITHSFKLTTLVVYAFSCAGMLLYTLTIDTEIWVIFISAGLLGFFMTGYLPLGFEFGAELTYPISEGTSSGLLNASAQIFGIVMTLSMGYLVQNYSVLSCNIALTVSLFLGTIATAFIKADLRRQQASKTKHEEESKFIVVLSSIDEEQSPTSAEDSVTNGDVNSQENTCTGESINV